MAAKKKFRSTFKCCTKCNRELPTTPEYFFADPRNTTDGLQAQCRKCRTKVSTAYRIEHPEVQARADNKHYVRNRIEENRKSREYFRKLKMEMVAAYGGGCACCAETTIEFLSLDHIYGDGGPHRRAVRNAYSIWLDLRAAGWPKDRYRVLCMNCNFATRYGKACPHSTVALNGKLVEETGG